MTHRDCLRLRPHARLHVMAGKCARRQRHRQLLTVTKTRGAAQDQPRPEGGEQPLEAYTVEQVAKMLNIGRDKVLLLAPDRPAPQHQDRQVCAGSPISNSPSSSRPSTTPR